jgi:hypothetical protein
MSFKGVSDFNKYKDLIKEYIVTNSRTSNTEIARLIADLHPNDNLNIQSFRIFIGKYRRNLQHLPIVIIKKNQDLPLSLLSCLLGTKTQV